MARRLAVAYGLAIILAVAGLSFGGALLLSKSPEPEKSLASFQLDNIAVSEKPDNSIVPTNPKTLSIENANVPGEKTQALQSDEKLDGKQRPPILSYRENKIRPDEQTQVDEVIASKSNLDHTPAQESFNSPLKSSENDKDDDLLTVSNIPKPFRPAWQSNAISMTEFPSQPHLAIVLYDAGIDINRTRTAIGLKGPLTFSFLPYAPMLAKQVQDARNAGHEIMAHIPMEPLNPALDTGPHALATGLTSGEINRRLHWALSQVPNIVGINNHMGSKFTSNIRGMDLVMRELRRLGLLFLDSRTTPRTIAAEVATQYQVPYAARDVFLDHESDRAFIHRQLDRLENLAKRRGYAVAIGHPRENTIEVLGNWLPIIAEKGLALVPISVIIKKAN